MSERGSDVRGAVRIFAGPVLESSRLCDGELRWLVIGVVDGVDLAVVYVDRGGRRRIITARRASKNERREDYARFAAGADPPEG